MNSNNLDRSPVHLLHRAVQCVGDVFDQVIGKKDLTPRQLLILSAVADKEGASQTDIVIRTNIDRSTTSDVIKRLQRHGLLQRRRSKEDARAYAVTLTEEGRRVLRHAAPLSRRIDARVLGALPGGQRERFIEALSAIVKALEVPSSQDGKA
jgi:MarR family transcriptional regulator, temperature-dependent positive regulator of motility